MAEGWGRRSRRRADAPRVYRVAEVNRAARECLENEFRAFWVEGEISQVTRSAAGHAFFTLSDEREQARLDVTVFATDLRRVRTQLLRGARVRVLGRLTVWEKAGRFQMQGRQVLAAGAGDLQAQFEAIHKRLAAEGLLRPERKRALPRLPRTVGVVTSVGSAALRDIVRVAQARCPVRIVVSDCRVSGRDAERSIVAALERVQRLPELDLVILGRGGGSAEELWAFNAEDVARAVAACRVPVVCGVGHETDVSIAELVADRRASTPSNAAEIAIPEREALAAELDHHLYRLQRAMVGRFDHERLHLRELEARLPDPRLVLGRFRRAVVEHEGRAVRALRIRLKAHRARLRDLDRRLLATHPQRRLAADRSRLALLEERLRQAATARLKAADVRLRRGADRLRERGRELPVAPRARLAQLAARLRALSPLEVLERGYAIAFGPEGSALRRAASVAPGERIRVRLHDGELVARVEAIGPAPEPEP